MVVYLFAQFFSTAKIYKINISQHIQHRETTKSWGESPNTTVNRQHSLQATA